MTDTTDTGQTSCEPGVVILPSGTPVNEKRGRYWFITWNSYPPNWREIADTNTDGWKGQVEVGDETGNEHVHLSVIYKNPRTARQVRGHFPGAHVELTKCKPAVDNYCTKEETRLPDGPTDFFRYRHCVPYEWQSMLLDVVASEPDDRAVHWIWSNKGQVGKSMFVRHLVMKHNALVVSGSVGSDVKYACAEFGRPRLIVFDVPRDGGTVDYRTLEEVKNGVFFSGKYESRAVVFDYPHIIVFANFPPQLERLSADRWRVTELKGNSISENNTATPPC